jgi:Ca2+-binding EF-hand superfamily protein
MNEFPDSLLSSLPTSISSPEDVPSSHQLLFKSLRRLRNNQEKIDGSEFLLAIACLDSDLSTAFRAYDMDDDGVLHSDEFVMMLRVLQFWSREEEEQQQQQILPSHIPFSTFCSFLSSSSSLILKSSSRIRSEMCRLGFQRLRDEIRSLKSRLIHLDALI